jgi:hypothetical protein
MGRRYWADVKSGSGVEFKFMGNNDTTYLCKFRSNSVPLPNVGTIVTMTNGEKYEVLSCEISNNIYGLKITGTCVLRLLSESPLFGTLGFYN